MFGWFQRRADPKPVEAAPTGDGAKPMLDAVGFDTTGYAYQGEPIPGRLRVWHTPRGDGLGVYFFAVPPDLPADSDEDGLTEFYRGRAGPDGGKLVGCAVVTAGGVPAIRTLLSMPQQPSGRTYVGSLTVPFRDFSFVLKCQCAEGGPTGLKAALLFARSRAAGEPMTIEDGRFHIPGFDPDDPRHDAEFPNDPVARARAVLDHLTASMEIEEAVRKWPGFPLPPARGGSRP